MSKIKRNFKGQFLKQYPISRYTTYKSWFEMVKRCTNTKSKNYEWYHKRNITVIKKWFLFENFIKDMGIKPIGTTLERINNNKGYSKRNCKWATHKEQANNRSNKVTITYKKQTKTIGEWSNITNIKYKTLWTRYKKLKWPINKCLGYEKK